MSFNFHFECIFDKVNRGDKVNKYIYSYIYGIHVCIYKLYGIYMCVYICRYIASVLWTEIIIWSGLSGVKQVLSFNECFRKIRYLHCLILLSFVFWLGLSLPKGSNSTYEEDCRERLTWTRKLSLFSKIKFVMFPN